MADKHEETITVSIGGGESNGAQKNELPSSPLSSAPDHEDHDTPTIADQPLDSSSSSPSTSPNSREDTPPTASKKMAKGKRRVLVKKVPKKSKWNADNILTDPKSPLASADLRSILSNPMAWDILDKEEKAEILALFPDSQHILNPGMEDACPDFASLMNDDSFRYDCAAYTENIAQGRHDPEWLAHAWAAHERRKMGDFDEFLDNKFRDEWDVELPPDLKTKRGPAVSKEAGNVTMEGTETVKNESDKKEDINMKNSTSEKKDDPDIDSEVDELQRCDPAHQGPISVAIAQRKSSMMEIDGDDTRDELA
ncbi:hypothetical protein FVEG_04873 [Fusarium verticillioides 7600]|uniref:DEUBAD domain-containing protein n=1 Tax=Gibberella moniliformis (strain M3125 / FGSC 7600) TaxID=334819 RepID=W7M7A5_GIBM7|nr:hypothetical protein FVEG_04873 [Fusarium verticillioides 7600]EWG43364.1 hypothetical protein FVEG_04873 [Fusarium verticillioides 7600]